MAGSAFQINPLGCAQEAEGEVAEVLQDFVDNGIRLLFLRMRERHGRDRGEEEEGGGARHREGSNGFMFKRAFV